MTAARQPARRDKSHAAVRHPLGFAWLAACSRAGTKESAPMQSRFARALAAIAVVGALAVTTATTAFADARNFTVVNNSSLTITHLYVSAADTQSWEEDVLGKDVLAPGESWDITFSKYDGEAGKCLYDIKAVGKEGQEGVQYKLDLCSITSFTWND
jgi:hypothetical protein